jgi:SEC-C motif-containing protein
VRQERAAVTAEQLMRSRYTAFVLRDDAYLLHSWLPAARPRRVNFAPDQQWTGLEIVATEAGGLLDRTGIVEFVAHHRHGDIPGELHERSAFVRLDGRWVYAGADAAV